MTAMVTSPHSWVVAILTESVIRRYVSVTAADLLTVLAVAITAYVFYRVRFGR